MAHRPADPFHRSRRSAIAIVILGPIVVFMALVNAFGNAIGSNHANFASVDPVDIIVSENGVTELAKKSDD